MFVHFKQVQQSFGIFFNFKVQNGLKCHPWEFKGFLKVYLVKISLSLKLLELSEFIEYKRQSQHDFVCVETMESYQNFSIHSGNMNLSHER